MSLGTELCPSLRCWRCRSPGQDAGRAPWSLESVLLFLHLLGALGLPVTRADSHSLRFFYTAWTRPELGEPRFVAVGYVDDEEFVRFDSDGPNPRAEPRAAWMERVVLVDPEYWERNTRVGWKNSELYGEKLGALRRDLNLSRGGVHTLQFLHGCEVSPDGRLQRGFYQDAYDRQEDVASDVKTWTWTWTVFVPQLEISKHSWEEESEAERRLCLQEECVQWLHNYLEMGKEALTRTDPPSVRVTLSDTAHHGKVTLTCRAQDFYPAKISLTWLRDEEQLQDTEFIETRPGGDGTFQKWAAVGVTPGQEGRYTCQVQHKGLAEPLTLKWENNKTSSSSTWTILGVTVGVFLLLLAVAVVVFWRKKNSGRGEACGQAADNDRAQGTDVPLQSLVRLGGGSPNERGANIKHSGRVYECLG
ncbi:BOLA class I histocompatibility antigen, alpha chain BL3-7-like isoform X2 [Macrotis lagotis]|uniref:BOLA class I histocompatibility antigen, alpha chain BL3-7-like isoform X2 n=1 Tax=Macrotis lagotis TaxID=92651 RepID=UPI003D68EB8D